MPLGRRRPHKLELKGAVLVALAGVGNKGLGEWWEWNGRCMHLRRRLSLEEQAEFVGPVVDCRGTDEWQRRLDLMKGVLPEPALRLAEMERGNQS
jgi:hypothetical protein